MSNSILSSLTFLSYSLGCRTNQAEMESIGLQLIDYGLQQLDDSLLLTAYRLRQPDLVLINTCVVTQKAEKETRQKIRELRKKYPKCFLVVLGCGVTAKEKFKIDLPEADLYISNENKKNTLDLIKSKLLFEPSREQSTEFFSTPPTDVGIARRITLSNKYIQSGRKFIKIQDGCNCGCSFCLTQFLRGKPTSVPPEDIIEEINFWVDKGVKEIILTGINIGLYNYQRRRLKSAITTIEERDPSTEPVPSEVEGVGTTITKLVDRILKKTKIERISFSSIYPEMLTNDFIKLVVNNPRVSQYFHLSLQSGSQTVLQRMNRKYNINELTDYLLFIKKINQGFTFRADIITGFPDETEKEFQETIDFIKKTKISFAHPFHFSTRQGTKAGQMISSKEWHEVPSLIKKQRTKILNKEVENIRKEEAKYLIAKLQNCLIVRKVLCHSDQAHSASSGQAPRVEESLSSVNFLTTERDPSTPPPIASSVGMTKNLNIDLIDSRSRPSGLSGMTLWEGIMENGWNIKIKDQRSKIKINKGIIIPTKIIGFEKDYLIGKILSLPTS